MAVGRADAAAVDATGTPTGTIAWVLRVATAGCFIGHGAFGVITKAAWLPYFAVAGIPASVAWPLMPVVGSMDILLGLLVLFAPSRALLVWCVVWTAWTAALRPLSGESVWELLERAGNYGAPLALLALAGWGGRLRGSWFARLVIPDNALDDDRARQTLRRVLRLATVTLLVGHAGCNVFDAKPAFLHLYQFVQPDAGPALLTTLGLIEFGLAATVLLSRSPLVLLGIVAWKVATEALWPLVGSPVWEFVERFGSYGVPLALALLLAADRPRSLLRPL